MTTFRVFEPTTQYMGTHNERHSATYHLNNWLREHPTVEVVSWQAVPIGTENELYIVIQYRRTEDED